jgi:hypothetical protein
VVRDEVLVNLDHRPPRNLLVLEPRLAANTDDARVVSRRSDQAVERVGLDTGVGVDHKHELAKRRELILEEGEEGETGRTS